ncbi:MAG: hypothetical protein HMLKMBBP_00103 [Planctomycetes bacterium]|nr:hypothetical protein [Planctomycetota bacterium]
MAALELPRALTALAPRRPLFHSEADFQHALAWELAASGLATEIRLERPLDHAADRLYVDVVARVGDTRVAIELKYWSRVLAVEIDGETFRLKSGAAQDVRRYDFWKDVERVQTLLSTGIVDVGFVLALTNDPGYWTPGRDGTVDRAFRMADGSMVRGELAWDPRASEGTRKGRERTISIRQPVPLRWADYSVVGTERFRYVLVPLTR